MEEFQSFICRLPVISFSSTYFPISFVSNISIAYPEDISFSSLKLPVDESGPPIYNYIRLILNI